MYDVLVVRGPHVVKFRRHNSLAYGHQLGGFWEDSIYSPDT